MDFEQKNSFKNFDPQTACSLNTCPGFENCQWISLSPSDSYSTLAFKGGNTTLNYPNIQFLRKLGEWQCTLEVEKKLQI